MEDTDLDHLSVTLAAVADPTRRALLRQLMKGPRSVHELTEPFQLSQQAVSKHLAFLERAKLIEKRKEGRQSICRLNSMPLRELASWVDEYRVFWEQAVDRLEVFLTELENDEGKNGR